jgi:hypothetical protein
MYPVCFVNYVIGFYTPSRLPLRGGGIMSAPSRGRNNKDTPSRAYGEYKRMTIREGRYKHPFLKRMWNIMYTAQSLAIGLEIC